MPCDRADHCPFLNRRDARCGRALTIAGLGHAYGHCFGSYQTCPVYYDLLIERRARRAEVSMMGKSPVNDDAANLQLTIYQATLASAAINAARLCKAASGARAHANAA